MRKVWNLNYKLNKEALNIIFVLLDGLICQFFCNKEMLQDERIKSYPKL